MGKYIWGALWRVIVGMILAITLYAIVSNDSIKENTNSLYPFELIRAIPLNALNGLQLIDENSNSGFRDAFEVRIYSLTEYAIEQICAHMGGSNSWHSLPMTKDEYKNYVQECCGWPLEEYSYFEQYHLTDDRCEGEWYYIGSFNEEAIRKKEGLFRYFGHHILILVLEEENFLIYVEVDT